MQTLRGLTVNFMAPDLALLRVRTVHVQSPVLGIYTARVADHPHGCMHFHIQCVPYPSRQVADGPSDVTMRQYQELRQRQHSLTARRTRGCGASD